MTATLLSAASGPNRYPCSMRLTSTTPSGTVATLVSSLIVVESNRLSLPVREALDANATGALPRVNHLVERQQEADVSRAIHQHQGGDADLLIDRLPVNGPRHHRGCRSRHVLWRREMR